MTHYKYVHTKKFKMNQKDSQGLVNFLNSACVFYNSLQYS